MNVTNVEDFEVVDVGDKLNLLMSEINKVNTTFHYKFTELSHSLSTDIVLKITQIESTQQELAARLDDIEGAVPKHTQLMQHIEQLETANAQLQDDVAIIKGLIQVQDRKVLTNQNKIADLTARSMGNNILLSGLIEKEKEDCKVTARLFLKEKMKMVIQDEDVIVAHRLGRKSAEAGKPRQMVIKCSHFLRENIFKHVVHLKDVKNDHGDYYYIRQQLPEPMLSQQIERQQKIKEVKKANAEIQDVTKHRTIEIKNKVLCLDKVPQKQFVTPPTIIEVFNCTKEDRKKIDKIKVHDSSVVTEKKSSFRGFAVWVKNTVDVRLAYKKLKTLYPESDHIMMAYTVKNFSGNQDDGEFGASKRLLELLGDRKNLAIFVAREYGCTHLGQRRFIYIDKVAKEALASLDEDMDP